MYILIFMVRKMKLYFLATIICSSVIYILLRTITTSVRDVIGSKLFKDFKHSDNKQMKYILLWTSNEKVPFVYMGKGQLGFLERKCPHVNCFVTSNIFLLGDYTHFDVIAFSGPQLENDVSKLPEKRSSHQKYVFASIESPDNYPICNNLYNDFFNWTWTYKLDSEVRWGYIIIRDTSNNIIGPKQDMSWLKLEQMDPVTEDFKNKLKTKNKAAAWFASNCITKNKREQFVQELRNELYKYDSDVDIYGNCGTYLCSRNENECRKKIAEEYYFYLSFENGFSEDYVTKMLLVPLKNNAVPIVYGGANYTRFMPDGIYLNARELGVKKLAAKMNELMNDPEKYAQYFKWKNHYSYHNMGASLETNVICKICEKLNDEEAMKETTVHHNFTNWWNVPNSC